METTYKKCAAQVPLSAVPLLAFIGVLISCGMTTAQATPLFTNGEKAMYNIQITLNDATVTGTLDDTPATRDFVAQLPLTVKLDDYSSTEKITYLPKKLSTLSAPAGITPRIGDITYYAPWGNIAIFYQNFAYSPGLIKLGEITNGIEHLHYRGAKQATITLID